MAAKNSLTISLAESVVFLRGVDFSGRRHHSGSGARVQDTAPPAILRGLLTLELVKPTRITSIEIELQAKASTTLPDPGVGPRQPNNLEEQKIYSATQVFFRASDPSAPSTSTPSLPSTSAAPTSPPAYDFASASTYTSRRALSVDPGLHLYRDDADDTPERAHPPAMFSAEAAADRGRNRQRRRQSADFSIHQTDYVLHQHEFASPPLSPPPPSSLSRRDSDHSGSGQGHAPASGLPTAFTRTPAYTPDVTPPMSPVAGPSPGVSTHDMAFFALPPNMEYEARSASASRTPSRAPSRTRLAMMHPSPSAHTSASHSRAESLDDADAPHTPTHPYHSPSHSQTRPQLDRDASADRGRRSATRFSLAAVSNSILDAVKERVRAGSPNVVERGRTKEKVRDEGDEGVGGGVGARGVSAEGVLAHLGLHSARHADEDHHEQQHQQQQNGKEFGNGWKEFKKGTYTFPVSFSIPSHMPPTLTCAFGTVSWRLKAHVHRPGVLTAKMSGSRDVTVVATPSDDDTEDTDNIVVERFWDDQLQYMFTVAGRMFPIGGVVPVEFTFLPMAKMKIFRLALYIEERIEYYVHNARVSRSEPAQRAQLLALKHDKDQPLLPLPPSELPTSPLLALTSSTHNAEDHDDAAATLMGPGPWTLSADLRVPSTLHPTNKNKRANVVIAHALKIVMRVEGGDDAHVDTKTGRRKQFEIVVHSPIILLSPLADTKYTALPGYLERPIRTHTTSAPLLTTTAPTGPTPTSSGTAGGEVHHHHHNHNHNHNHHHHHHPPTAVDAPTDDSTLQDRYERYERLITGQESEVGEAPPAYTPHQLDAVRELAGC